MSTIQLDIITPDETLYSGIVDSVQVQGTEGKFQVLNNHAPMIAALAAGNIKLSKDGQEENFNAGSGVLEVLENKVIILTEGVKETPEEQ